MTLCEFITLIIGFKDRKASSRTSVLASDDLKHHQNVTGIAKSNGDLQEERQREWRPHYPLFHFTVAIMLS